MAQRSRIGEIVLEAEALTRPSAELEADRNSAIADLLHENRFIPKGAPEGPYTLHLGLNGGGSCSTSAAPTAARSAR